MDDKVKEELLQELCRLYRLKAEGKHVDTLIADVEAKLFGAIDNDTESKKKEGEQK